MGSQLRATYWVWRRELAVMLRAPIIYVVGGLFLVVQGIAFAGLVGALSNPRRPALLGELLEGQLAGTLLTWLLELVVLTLLGMRAVADDKRNGSWEALLTAGVGEGAAIAGKWLAATTLYMLIWLPTLAYFAVVAAFRAEAGGWDIASIAIGYAGAFAVGAALLAWAIAASAATSSILAAGALGFAWLVGAFLVGELPGLWPELTTDHPSIALALETVSLRGIAGELARGYIGLRALIVLAGGTLVGLSVAIGLACAGRRRRRVLWLRGLGAGLLAVIWICAAVLAARHPVGVDVSRAHRSSLDDATRAVLAELPGPPRLIVVEPTTGALEPVYDEVWRVAVRIADAAPGASARRVDPASAPGGLTAVAREAGLAPGDLAAGGAVIVELGDKRRVLDLFAFAAINAGPDGAAHVERLAIEQSIAGALAQMAMPEPKTICATRGHGELPVAPPSDGAAPNAPNRPSTADRRDWSLAAGRLRGDGMAIDEVDVMSGVPARCAALVVAGPTQPLSPDEALAVQAHVQRGGGLVVLAGDPVDGGLPATGLDAVLAADGLGLPAAIVIDPALEVRDLPGALHIIDGYADHPINRGFAGVRFTMWYRPRAVSASGRARPLISASAASWGERNFYDPPARDVDDLAGPAAIAAIGGTHRVIAVGSVGSIASGFVASHGSAADLWLARAIEYAAGMAEPAIAASRPPDQVRLVMTDGQRRMVIAISVGGIPLAWALIGGVVVAWRRRRSP